MKNRLSFPSNFLWGTATAAHQVEGGNTNNDWYFFEKEKKTVHKQLSGKASDHYNRFEEDFDIAHKLHHSIHRFSIEWSRIEPKEGVFDMDALVHYQQVIRALQKRDMKVMVTLQHFTVPQWFAKKGGWCRSDAVSVFSRYVEYVVSHLIDEVDFWITINEPINYVAKMYLFAMAPPAHKSLRSFFKAFNAVVAAHKEAYFLIHRLDRFAQVGFSHYVAYIQPYRKNSVRDKLVARLMRYLSNDYFLKRVCSHSDFLGLSYFNRIFVQFKLFGYLGCFKEFGVLNTEYNGKKCDLGWNIHPEGLYYSLKIVQKYGLPIYIVENGVADKEDSIRADFIRDHVVQVHRALQEGVDVRAYLYWTLLDDFGWTYGRDERYGLVKIDYENNLKRTIRPSAGYYAKICEENAITI